MCFNPLLSTLWRDMEGAAVQNAAPVVWVRCLQGMRIVPLYLGNTQVRYTEEVKALREALGHAEIVP